MDQKLFLKSEYPLASRVDRAFGQHGESSMFSKNKITFRKTTLNYDFAWVAIFKNILSSVVFNPPVYSKYGVNSQVCSDCILHTGYSLPKLQLEVTSKMCVRIY